MSKLIGTAPNQVPSNADLGTMAYQDYDVVAPQLLGGRRNMIINGDARIWQRGTPSTYDLNNNYSADRWKHTSYLSAMTSSQNSSVPTGQGFQTSLKLYNTSAATPGSTNTVALIQSIEGYDFAHMMWGSSSAKNITVSFWVRSNLTGTYALTAFNPTNPRSIQEGNRWYISYYNIDQPNTWQKIVLNIPGCTDGTWNTTNGTGLSLYWDLGIGSGYTTTASNVNKWISTAYGSTTECVDWNATTGNDFYITGLQVESGDTATPFEFRSYGEELALCQRYYYRFGHDNINNYSTFAWGTKFDSTRAFVVCSLPVNLRSEPSLAFHGNLRMINATGWTEVNTGTATFGFGNTEVGGSGGYFRIDISGDTIPGNVGDFVRVEKTGDYDAGISFDAEL